ncbi:MAG: hypothetical protein H7257_05925 [Taibaiella sp.]|nr:hypothetical protein [Taibaiella sp.]
MKKTAFLFLILALQAKIYAQGTLSGDLQTNINFFQKDTAIKASDNPLYDNYLSGSETWLSLRYNVKGWTFTLRADAFNNSNLYNPAQALTAYGIGAYSITKDMDDLTVTVGYIYDQVGSGVLFRAYEDRGLLIDNALVGLELKYKLGKNVLLKAFTGQQKFILEKYKPIIRGFNAEGDYSLGAAHLIPGVGVLNRTLDKDNMDQVAATINGYELKDRFLPRYNMYAFTAYNTLTYKNLSWYVEGAYKTHEAIVNSENKLVDENGNVEFTTLNYAKKGFALNLSAKRTDNFQMRVTPNTQPRPIDGNMNWQPVVARLRPQRLMARYTPASQDLSELAFTLDGLYSPNDVTSYSFTYTNISTLDNTPLYREGLADVYYQGIKSWRFQLGVQYMEYNQRVYQVKQLDKPIVYAITPYTEITYRLTDTKSLRLELQYQKTQQDFGSWAYALLEYNFVPNFSISISDMYNIDPNYSAVSKANHYYSVYGAFTKGPHRLSLAYVKQVAGINCTGGVCRYEPAFSGIRSTFTTNF